MAERANTDYGAEGSQRVADAHGYLRIDDKRPSWRRSTRRSRPPGFWDDAAHAQGVSKQACEPARHHPRVRRGRGASGRCAARRSSWQARTRPSPRRPSALLGELADAARRAGDRARGSPERFDGGDAILTVNPGSGGLEAQDWTDMLYRMYVRYAEKKDWKVHGARRGARARASGWTRPPSRSRAATPTACCAARAACTASCASAPPTTRSAATPRSPAWRCCRCCPTTSRWTSTPPTCAWTCTAPAAPAASASTPPTRPCALPTCPRASW